MSDLRLVWGLDSGLIEELEVRCTLDTSLVRPFCVKALSFDSLRAHPRWITQGHGASSKRWGAGFATWMNCGNDLHGLLRKSGVLTWPFVAQTDRG